jgi:hypothetical protein
MARYSISTGLRDIVLFSLLLCGNVEAANWCDAGLDLKCQIWHAKPWFGSANFAQTWPPNKVIVFIAYLKGCPILQKYGPILSRIGNRFHGTAEFVNIDSRPDDPKAVHADLVRFNNHFPILIDANQDLTRALGLTTASEVAVVEPKTWRVIYRGAIDNAITFDYQLEHPSKSFLEDVLQDQMDGKSLAFSTHLSYGCSLNIRRK